VAGAFSFFSLATTSFSLEDFFVEEKDVLTPHKETHRPHRMRVPFPSASREIPLFFQGPGCEPLLRNVWRRSVFPFFFDPSPLAERPVLFHGTRPRKHARSLPARTIFPHRRSETPRSACDRRKCYPLPAASSLTKDHGPSPPFFC